MRESDVSGLSVSNVRFGIDRKTKQQSYFTHEWQKWSLASFLRKHNSTLSSFRFDSQMINMQQHLTEY